MKERPILMSAPMVRAILAGTKTQTRRVVSGIKQPADLSHPGSTSVDHVYLLDDNGRWRFDGLGGASRWEMRCSYGQPGDRLWVRETFKRIDGQTQAWIETDYRATYTHGDRLGDSLGIKKRWTPAIHMPRHASRITLEVTGVRVERLQHISEADAIAEGIHRQATTGWFSVSGIDVAGTTARAAYALLWDSINGPGSWKANPWVWVVQFKVLKPQHAAG